MRRAIFLTLGFLELCVAILLLSLGFQLPSDEDVDGGFGHVAAVTGHTGEQVHLMRQQVRELRRPELQELAARLRTQTRLVTESLKAQRINFDEVRIVRGALGDVAEGLDGFGQTLDGNAPAQLGKGLGVTADFLDTKLAPSAGRAADELDKATGSLKADAEGLATLLRQAPPDLKAARDVYDGLGRFGDALDKMNGGVAPERLGAMREGFRGLDDALSTGAEQVERLAGYSYPVMTLNGIRFDVEMRKFWPEGERIAEGMRKAAEGVKAAGKEVADLSADLPKLKRSLTESRKIADATRTALGGALSQQDRLEKLLKDVPERSARLAEELPKLSGELARVLRDTQKLKEVAGLLRETQGSLDRAVARWPELRKAVSRSADLLRTTEHHLQESLDNRKDYEAALQQTVTLAEAFANLLPLYTQQIDAQLADQDRALADLGASVDSVTDALPPYARAASRLLRTAKLLLWLLAGVAGLHGAYLALSYRLGPRPQPGA